MITKLSDLTEKTQNNAIKSIAVAAAGDYHVLLAIKEAVDKQGNNKNAHRDGSNQLDGLENPV